MPGKTAGPSGPAAAAAEAIGESRTVEHDGLTLTLPAELPEEILFDIVEIEAAEGAANEYLICLRVLRSLVGAEQFTLIRHRFGRDSEQVVGVLNAVLEPFGMSLGESEASPDS